MADAAGLDRDVEQVCGALRGRPGSPEARALRAELRAHGHRMASTRVDAAVPGCASVSPGESDDGQRIVNLGKRNRPPGTSARQPRTPLRAQRQDPSVIPCALLAPGYSPRLLAP